MNDNRNYEFAKCPQCGHIFKSSETFHWELDDDGDPTIEFLYCPNCGNRCPGSIICDLEEECAACVVADFDDFEVVEKKEEGK